MQLEFIFQNPLVIFVVLFGMSCTMGLSVVIPLVANVILAVYSGWVGDLAASKANGATPGSVFPDERPDFPKQVVGYEPGHEPKKVAPGPVQVEPDHVPVGMLARLAFAVTLAAAVLVLGGVKLFEARVASEMAAKGYEDTTTAIPHAKAK